MYPRGVFFNIGKIFEPQKFQFQIRWLWVHENFGFRVLDARTFGMRRHAGMARTGPGALWLFPDNVSLPRKLRIVVAT